MNASVGYRFSILLPIAFAACCVSTESQESIDTLLERGYVANWLVCGPFVSDVPGGIIAAVSDNRRPLGSKDFMAPEGGIARIRPQAHMKIRSDRGIALWQQAGAEDASLDLSPFFPNDAEGVSYAGFYVNCDGPREVYADLQTPLGARAYLNGFPVREIYPAPVTRAGLDRFIMSLRSGTNLLIFELPGSTFDGLARAAGMTVGDFIARGMANRPLLQGKSGFEIALRLRPVQRFGDLAIVPRLESTGTFTGRDGDVRQDALLTIHNTGRTSTRPIGTSIQVAGVRDAVEQVIAPIPADSQQIAVLSVPVGDTTPGLAVSVAVTLTLDKQSVTIPMSITAQEPSAQGSVYIVTGARVQNRHEEDQAAATVRHRSQLARQIFLGAREGDYGFDLGRMDLWRPAWNMHPELREDLLEAIVYGRVAALPGYGVPDERIVRGEVLARNLAYGRAGTEAILNDWNSAYFYWNAPAMAPQSVQLLRDAGVGGIVSNLPYGGIPALSYLLGPDGSAILHRRKQTSTPPGDVDTLRKMASLQRGEMLDLGMTSDLLVLESRLRPPEPYWLGATTPLARALPSIKLTGAGGRDFFDDFDGLTRKGADRLSSTARTLTGYQPGALATQVELKRAYALLENTTLRAETFATFAALIGAEYPSNALDYAWRHLLHASDTNRVGYASTPQIFLDTLSALREAIDYSDQVLANSMGYIASQAKTDREVLPDALPVVVFNPSSWQRTDVCRTELVLNQAAGLTLFDDAGERVPFFADEVSIVNTRIARARITFVAEDIPPLGYKTYYLTRQGALPEWEPGEGNIIENDRLRVTGAAFQGGAMASVVHKESGVEFVDDLWNDVIALEEDRQSTDSGRDLWTTGAAVRASESPAEINIETLGWMQRMTVTSPFLGGTLERTISLFDGIPKVFCTMRLVGASRKNQLLLATFPSGFSNVSPLVGERYGARLARRSPELERLQTKGMANPSATGATPALHWAAVGPGDHIRAGSERVWPLGPATIIHGDSEVAQEGARTIQKALASRGIPASVMADSPRKLNAVWTDSTEFQDYEADLALGTAFRIVLGTPEENRFATGLFQQLSSSDIALFRQRTREGGALLMEDAELSGGRAPVPTLLLAGLVASQTADMADAFANAIADTGIYHLAPEAFVTEGGGPHPGRGFAVLFEGSMLSVADEKGTLALALSHGDGWSADEAAVFGLERMNPQFEYALFPFFGDWRDAGLQKAGLEYNAPLAAVVTDVHVGNNPAEMRFLTVETSDFLVTGVFPAKAKPGAMSGVTKDLRSGVGVRGFDTANKSGDVKLTFFTDLADAGMSSVVGRPGAAVRVTRNEAIFRRRPSGITTLWLQPNSMMSRGEPLALDVSAPAGVPAYTRYWLENSGAAPLGNQPVSVILEGDLDSDTGAIRALVANNLTDTSITGTVFLNAPVGWNMAPSRFDYALGAGEFLETEIVVLREQQGDSGGGIVARTEYQGRTYQDLLTTGDATVAVELTRNGNEIRATVSNQGALPAEGYLELIVPFGQWRVNGGPSVTTVSPRRVPVFVGAFQEERYLFQTAGPLPDFWMVAKLAANGQVVYEPLSQ